MSTLKTVGELALEIVILTSTKAEDTDVVQKLLTQDRATIHTSLVAAVEGLEYNENDIDGNHSYDRARQNEGFKYAKEEVLTIINSIFKE